MGREIVKMCPSPELLGQRLRHEKFKSPGSDSSKSAVFPIVGYVNGDQQKMVEDTREQLARCDSFEIFETERSKRNPVTSELKYVCEKVSSSLNFRKKAAKLKRA